MGVKDLWNVLGPVSQKTPLYSLQDKSVAIDLSCWVCEGQSIGERSACTQPRMYLRTLFFRTCTLLMMNVKPIFILEGDAPEAKLDAMKQRNDARFQRYRDPSDDVAKKSGRQRGARSRFKGVLKQCKQMLDMMGVPCIQGDGEAEALCAQLNQDGVVDAVITQDSDVFLYGASTVYRHLTIKSGSGTVDVYSMTDIEEKLHLDRDKLVAMSVLCGCDYDLAGVHGVGKEMAFKYLSGYQGDALHRLRTLRSDQTLQRLEDEKNGCGRCCHPGKLSEHKKAGCLVCCSDKGCDENLSPRCFKNLSEEEKKNVALEMNLRRKALHDPDFPNEATIKEYMENRQDVGRIDKSWKRPDICKFVQFCVKMLEWEMDYAFEKVLPLYTRWVLLNSKSLPSEELQPKDILKKRVVKGVPSFDVGWQCVDENVNEILTFLPEDCSCLVNDLCVTVEPQALMSEKLPELCAEFIEKTAKKKPVKAPRAKKAVKSKKTDDDLSTAMADLTVETAKKGRKKNKSKTNEIAEVGNECAELENETGESYDWKEPWDERYDYLENSQIFDGNYGNSARSLEASFKSPLGDRSFDHQFNTSRSVEDTVLFPPTVTSEILEDPSILSPEAKRKSSALRPLVSPIACKPLPKNLHANFDISFDISNLSIADASSPIVKPSQLRMGSYSASPVADKSLISNRPLEGASNDVSAGYETIMISEDESTVEYDISAILDDIISRKQYY